MSLLSIEKMILDVCGIPFQYPIFCVEMPTIYLSIVVEDVFVMAVLLLSIVTNMSELDSYLFIG